MYIGISAWCVVLLAGGCRGAGWRWPDAAPAPSLRIDTKVRFIDAPDRDKSVTATTVVDINNKRVQSDEVPFKEPTDTEGFYNRAAGRGRYPVRVERPRAQYQVDPRAVYPVQDHRKNNRLYNDGTLDSVQYCKCVSEPDCNPRPDPEHACGSGKFLCCYKRPNKQTPLNTEYFNEIDDERPMLLPGNENFAGPFPPPPDTELNGLFGPGHGHETALLGAAENDGRRKQPVLVGPEGPTGTIGPPNRPILVGPNGPTGKIGPSLPNQPVLVGPGGPTGNIGPTPNVVEPVSQGEDVRQSGSAQRGVLVGPGGPTGIIGPYNPRGVLVGPGGPTGVIGPGNQRVIGHGYDRYNNRPGLLVGPGGPTGTIGPGRQLLVGPGGPTGRIGPPRYF